MLVIVVVVFRCSGSARGKNPLMHFCFFFRQRCVVFASFVASCRLSRELHTMQAPPPRPRLSESKRVNREEKKNRWVTRKCGGAESHIWQSRVDTGIFRWMSLGEREKKCKKKKTRSWQLGDINNIFSFRKRPNAEWKCYRLWNWIFHWQVSWMGLQMTFKDTENDLLSFFFLIQLCLDCFITCF